MMLPRSAVTRVLLTATVATLVAGLQAPAEGPGSQGPKAHHPVATARSTLSRLTRRAGRTAVTGRGPGRRPRPATWADGVATRK